MEITKEKFLAYTALAEDGINMFDVSKVKRLSKEMYKVNLEFEETIEIMDNYNEYYKKFIKI